MPLYIHVQSQMRHAVQYPIVRLVAAHVTRLGGNRFSGSAPSTGIDVVCHCLRGNRSVWHFACTSFSVVRLRMAMASRCLNAAIMHLM